MKEEGTLEEFQPAASIEVNGVCPASNPGAGSRREEVRQWMQKQKMRRRTEKIAAMQKEKSKAERRRKALSATESKRWEHLEWQKRQRDRQTIRRKRDQKLRQEREIFHNKSKSDDSKHVGREYTNELRPNHMSSSPATKGCVKDTGGTSTPLPLSCENSPLNAEDQLICETTCGSVAHVFAPGGSLSPVPVHSPLESENTKMHHCTDKCTYSSTNNCHSLNSVHSFKNVKIELINRDEASCATSSFSKTTMSSAQRYSLERRVSASPNISGRDANKQKGDPKSSEATNFSINDGSTSDECGDPASDSQTSNRNESLTFCSDDPKSSRRQCTKGEKIDQSLLVSSTREWELEPLKSALQRGLVGIGSSISCANMVYNQIELSQQVSSFQPARESMDVDYKETCFFKEQFRKNIGRLSVVDMIAEDLFLLQQQKGRQHKVEKHTEKSAQKLASESNVSCPEEEGNGTQRPNSCSIALQSSPLQNTNLPENFESFLFNETDAQKVLCKLTNCDKKALTSSAGNTGSFAPVAHPDQVKLSQTEGTETSCLFLKRLSQLNDIEPFQNDGNSAALNSSQAARKTSDKGAEACLSSSFKQKAAMCTDENVEDACCHLSPVNPSKRKSQRHNNPSAHYPLLRTEETYVTTVGSEEASVKKTTSSTLSPDEETYSSELFGSEESDLTMYATSTYDVDNGMIPSSVPTPCPKSLHNIGKSVADSIMPGQIEEEASTVNVSDDPTVPNGEETHHKANASAEHMARCQSLLESFSAQRSSNKEPDPSVPTCLSDAHEGLDASAKGKNDDASVSVPPKMPCSNHVRTIPDNMSAPHGTSTPPLETLNPSIDTAKNETEGDSVYMESASLLTDNQVCRDCNGSNASHQGFVGPPLSTEYDNEDKACGTKETSTCHQSPLLSEGKSLKSSNGSHVQSSILQRLRFEANRLRNDHSRIKKESAQLTRRLQELAEKKKEAEELMALKQQSAEFLLLRSKVREEELITRRMVEKALKSPKSPLDDNEQPDGNTRQTSLLSRPPIDDNAASNSDDHRRQILLGKKICESFDTAYSDFFESSAVSETLSVDDVNESTMSKLRFESPSSSVTVNMSLEGEKDKKTIATNAIRDVQLASSHRTSNGATHENNLDLIEEGPNTKRLSLFVDPDERKAGASQSPMSATDLESDASTKGDCSYSNTFSSVTSEETDGRATMGVSSTNQSIHAKV